jgi:hypothetical protein
MCRAVGGVQREIRASFDADQMVSRDLELIWLNKQPRQTSRLCIAQSHDAAPRYRSQP